MLASLGGDTETVTQIASDNAVVIANDNAPGQLVLSGERARLTAVETALNEQGMKVMWLNVAGAFHSPFMADAVEEFERALQDVEVHDGSVTVYSCVTAQPIDNVRGTLASALTSPVRWRETVLALDAAGVDAFVDAGPNVVLKKMLKRILRESSRV